jgi:hypothetical protein
MQRQTLTFTTVLLISMLCGCQHPLPAGFVKVDPGWETQFRAVSADGAAITHRSEANPENGDLAFWEKAVQMRLVEYRGYKVAQRREITHGDGTPGVELTFDYERDGTSYTYLLRILVKGRRVHCIEAAGEKNALANQLPAIEKAIAGWPL